MKNNGIKPCGCKCHVDNDTSLQYERGFPWRECYSCNCHHPNSKYINEDGTLDKLRFLAVLNSIRKRK